MPPIVDNYTEAENKKYDLIIQIQDLYNNGNSIRKIARITGKNRRTVKKYIKGDPDILCRIKKHSPMDCYTDYIIKEIMEGKTASTIAKQLKESGETTTLSNIRDFVRRISIQYGLEISKYCNTSSKYTEDGSKKTQRCYVTRKGIFNYLWMNGELTETHYQKLWGKYSVLPELERCIREFREIFKKKNMNYLYIFIDRYKKSHIKELASFAKGLDRDLNAVENAVASPLSNGFVEGTNSKVKTIKKSMYGRCGKILLEAKLMYEKPTHY